MDRRLIIYSVLLVAVIGIIIYIDSATPKPINWTPSYGVKDKIPFGLYILDKESTKLFKSGKVSKFTESPYEFFEKEYDYENQAYTAAGSFMAIEEKSTIDRESVNELFNFAAQGNTIFLSMQELPETLLDSLKIKTKTGFHYTDSLAMSVNKTDNKKYYFSEGISFITFDSLDTATSRVLGYQEVNGEQLPNFIKIPVGDGQFLLHTQPAVFTNFHLLKGNHFNYAEDVLSALPQGNVYWRTAGFGSGKSSSPLRYILSQKGLKWAFYMSLIGLVTFMFFNAKRKQRIIEEIEPVRNTTIDFAKTIGNLYFQEGDHHTIIEKKIIYFLERIRRDYLIDTFSLDEAFVEKLHLKSGIEKQDIEDAVTLIKKQRHQFQSTEADVIKLNKAIEKLRL